jgi:hypothetical protein
MTDEEVYRMLMGKIFPAQATVVTVSPVSSPQK